ncbi:MAG: aspartate/glutamate racemase family protein [Candidatus Accumulibacter sp.]|jgi:aspartate racemase|nr:aspartate/glutamate racemase family protein [Accumulibacter sp.]
MEDDLGYTGGLAENRRFGLVDVPGAARFLECFSGILTSRSGGIPPEVLFSRFDENGAKAVWPEAAALSSPLPLSALKIRIFDAVRGLEESRVDAVLLPCFSCQAFIEEIEAETVVPIVGLMEPLRAELARRHPAGGRIGILYPGYLRGIRFFERHFPEDKWTLLYPAREVIEDADETPSDQLERLFGICRDLTRQGAESIIVGDVTRADAVESLRARGFPVVNALRIYAEHAAATTPAGRRKPFKIGIAGGVGPAATVDFLGKIVSNTPARRDQEHLKVVVEQNPQIPDRTAHLLHGDTDPTIALYATCKRLEAAGADIAAIPCNTAHAFVARIQPFLSIPIVNMLRETAECIRREHGGCSKVGLLATSGTIASRVYHDAIVPAGFEVLVPDAENQARVMNAIYGPKGVKAGFTAGECAEDLLRALTSLVERGAEVIVLGCTELPLLLAQNEAFPVAGKTVAVLDPSDILARKCVSLGRSAG